jgi:hypothetical protein
LETFHDAGKILLRERMSRTREKQAWYTGCCRFHGWHLAFKS